MKLQAKSFPFFGRGGGDASEGTGMSVAGAAMPAGATVYPGQPQPEAQAEAASFVMPADGVFRYPRNWVALSKGAGAVLLALAFAHFAVVWLYVVQAPYASLANPVSWRVAGAVLGVLLVIPVSALLMNLLPALRPTLEGLTVRELTGWRLIPWDRIGPLRSMELTTKGRFLVMIPFTGPSLPRIPAPMLRIIPALAGASVRGEPGLLITSDMRGFDLLIQMMLNSMASAPGRQGQHVASLVDESFVMPVAQLLLDPNAALNRMVKRTGEQKFDEYGAAIHEEEPAVNWRAAIAAQALISLAPSILLMTDVLARIGRGRELPSIFATWALLLLMFGIAELPFVAKLVQATGDLMVGSGQFKRAANAYLTLQTPRALLILAGAVLVGLGAPATLAHLLWLGGIFLTTLLLTRFVRRLYLLPLSSAMIAGLGAVIFQIMLYAMYYGVR
jgi:hypothetical protein